MNVSDDLEIDLELDGTYQLYKVMSDISLSTFAEFIKVNPRWVVVPFSLPKLHEKFMPQDVSNLYTLLFIWLNQNCIQGWRIFLGCLVFESRQDSELFYQLWIVTRGTA